MANKKWLRIVWNDELWRDMEVPHANREETNTDTISLSDPDWDDMHRADVVAGTHDRNEIMAESSDSYPEQSDLKKADGQNAFLYASSEVKFPVGSIANTHDTSGQRKNDSPHVNSETNMMDYIESLSNEAHVKEPNISNASSVNFDLDAVHDFSMRRTGRSISSIPREMLLDTSNFTHVQSPVSLVSVSNEGHALSSRSMRSSSRKIDASQYEVQMDGGSSMVQTVRQVVKEQLAELKVYVLESDITEAQQAVKTVVKQASF